MGDELLGLFWTSHFREVVRSGNWALKTGLKSTVMQLALYRT